MSAKIEVLNISKTFDDLFTIKDVSLSLGEKEIAVILGPSGCGKSTLLHLVAGLVLPDGGSVHIEGVDYTGRTGRVGYMQQKSLLLPFARILDNVSLPLVIQGQSRNQARNQARKLLPYFGLSGFEDYYPEQLSGGMRQRAALLRTFMFNSDILVLDEPFAALDAITRHKMQHWLKNIQEHFGTSILFVTHDIEEALILGDRLYVLSDRPAIVCAQFNLKETPADLDREKQIREQILSILEV